MQPTASVTLATWLLAVAPVVLLLGLVLWGRFSTTVNAVITVAVSAVLAAAAFEAGPAVIATGLGKGAWVGVWILYVIWPALLMHHLAGQVGMTALGDWLARLLPLRTENILLLAWILPSFIQGVSGFGTPIAVAAPLLAALGLGTARSVALPLIGYHWAVGFGSMGSSFYMAALTAHLSHDERAELAVSVSILLGVNCLLAGILVALMAGGLHGLREGWVLIATAGTAMVVVQALVARLEPGVAALCAGGAGLLVVLLRRATAGEPEVAAREHDTERARAAIVPYLLLALVALAVFLPPALRAWVKSHLLLGPSFPGVPAPYNPIALAGHPGTFLLVACVGSLLVWRRWGAWPDGAGRAVRRGFLRQARKSSPPVLLLAAVAGLLVDTGMVTAVATGIAGAVNGYAPLASPLVGALGSFITGSTTSSNALFSALQSDLATMIGDRPADLLAGQQAGGNVGNSLAPVVIVLGLSALGATRNAGDVLRRTLPPACVLLAATVLTTWLIVLRHR